MYSFPFAWAMFPCFFMCSFFKKNYALWLALYGKRPHQSAQLEMLRDSQTPSGDVFSGLVWSTPNQIDLFFSFLETHNLSLALVSVYGTASPVVMQQVSEFSFAFHSPRDLKYIGSISLLRQVRPKPVLQEVSRKVGMLNVKFTLISLLREKLHVGCFLPIVPHFPAWGKGYWVEIKQLFLSVSICLFLASSLPGLIRLISWFLEFS